MSAPKLMVLLRALTVVILCLGAQGPTSKQIASDIYQGALQIPFESKQISFCSGGRGYVVFGYDFSITTTNFQARDFFMKIKQQVEDIAVIIISSKPYRELQSGTAQQELTEEIVEVLNSIHSSYKVSQASLEFRF